MPIIVPTVYHFDNQEIQHSNYTKLAVDYSKRTISCELLETASNIKIFQKKWFLQSYDKKRTIESDVSLLDFSLAQKFPNVTCETILFDGLLFKKLKISNSFSNFENWPNLAPGIQKFSLSNIFNFSISNYFKNKEDFQYYFCKSAAKQDAENFFCSLLDKDTGGIERKNNETHKILNIIGSEKYKILNLNIGIKQKNKTIQSTGIQFIIQNDDTQKFSIPPNIRFNSTYNGKNLECFSNEYLYTPNNDKIVWQKNNKEIPDYYSYLLPENFIQLGSSYTCTNNNGESDKFEVSRKYLEIIGLKQIEILENEENKIIHYDANLYLPENEYEWSCKNSLNIKCEVIKDQKDQAINLKITPSNIFKTSVFPEKIKLSLTVDDDLFEKEIIVFNSKKSQDSTLNISNNISFEVSKNENQFSCNLEDSLEKSAMYNIYWYLDNQEITAFRNLNKISTFLNENYITCIIAGKVLNRSILGAKSYFAENPSKENPSWLKDSYLVNINMPNKFFLFTENFESNIYDVNCSIMDQNNNIILNNVCEKQKDKTHYLIFNNHILNEISNYYKAFPPIDIFNLPELQLKISLHEKNNLRNYFSQIKFVNQNFKPNILASGIQTHKNGTQECYIFVKDPNNLFLSTEFYLEKNRITRYASSLNEQNFQENNFISKEFIEKLKKENIFFYSSSFKEKKAEDTCIITVSNGTTVAQVKTSINQNNSDFKKLLKNHQSEKYKISAKKGAKVDFAFNFVKKLDISNEPLQISFHPSNIELQKNPFSLQYSNQNEKKTLSIYYAKNIVENNLFSTLLKNHSDEKSNQNLLNENSKNGSENYFKSNEEENLNFFRAHFLSAYFSLNESKEHQRTNFICKSTPEMTNKFNNTYKYSILVNGENYLQLKSNKPSIEFELNDLKDSDTVICQIQFDDKIESTSYSKKDKANILSYCYGMDKNGSIFSFQCPNFKKLNYSIDYFKEELIKKVQSQFHNTNFISYVHMVLWTESQKNKMSLSFRVTDRE
ncbi:hypothetical protein [Fluviispira multicolorata]|uniref:Ig-like domain-containing protein n=1 Tax=Fluviispira multicolorata TaxID=2654512 RepID=A0A833N1U0_9BACT|nr:hypothetical protein [Fluviispira multicolorata]KAB8031747.1 hypothetical protein GCL57_03665 [Fluviispira multicolorata]